MNMIYSNLETEVLFNNDNAHTVRMSVVIVILFSLNYFGYLHY